MPDRFKNVLLSIDLGILPRFPATAAEPLSAASYIKGIKGFFSAGQRRLLSAFASPQLMFGIMPSLPKPVRSTAAGAGGRPVGALKAKLPHCASSMGNCSAGPEL
jgi:hypothetical protein